MSAAPGQRPGRQGKIPVGILGATGVVGQRLLSLLDHHPWFEPVWLAASDRSAGQTYAEATRWRLATPLPGRFASLRVAPATPEGCPARVVFASVDAATARQLEPAFAAAGHVVVSNSSALRMAADVPLLVPECNPDHVALVERQASYPRGGYVVTNPNCSTVGLVLALAPLERAFGLESVLAVTMQAVSGAGYPGVASLDILGNVVPYIAHEEEKMEEEAQKILGRLDPSGGIAPAPFAVSAHCNRVAVVDGHLESVSVKLRAPASPADVARVLRAFRGRPQELDLPSAPPAPVIVSDALDRPQPRFDVEAGGSGLRAGMSAVVGRIRPCKLLDVKFTVLSHNTLRGAAGAALLNAELLQAAGRL